MEGMKKIATRDSYGNALVELGKIHDDIVVLDSDLAMATKTVLFKKEFPNRHFDCGIAECNMIDVAAGMSTFGLVPFASSFAMFAAGRAFEQVRNTVGYARLNVKICATHGGISVGEDGASHQCCEDFALMRTIPNMVVMSPSDDIEARQMVKAVYKYKGAVYIRFSRYAVPIYHDENFKFEIGKGEIVRDGSDIAIIANGLTVSESIRAAEILKSEGISARVINIATIKPLDEEMILNAAKDCGKIITVEEHTIIGGLGDAVCSLLAEKNPVPVKRIGINDEFGHSGSAAELLKQFGLSAENICLKVREMLRKN